MFKPKHELKAGDTVLIRSGVHAGETTNVISPASAITYNVLLDGGVVETRNYVVVKGSFHMISRSDWPMFFKRESLVLVGGSQE